MEASFYPRHAKRHMAWYKRRVKGATVLATTVDLPTAVDLDAFDDFAFFVQDGGSTSPPDDDPFLWLLNRLVFAEKVESATSMKETLSQFIETAKAAKDLKRCPNLELVQSVYKKTRKGASLRTLMVDLIRWEGGIEYIRASRSHQS